jgi:hypothetical protein
MELVTGGNFSPRWKLDDKRKKKVTLFAGICRMFSDFVSLLQDLIPEAICSQNCHVNVGSILNNYGDLGV